MKNNILVLVGLVCFSLSSLADDQGFYTGLNIGVGQPDFNTPNGEDKISSLVSGVVLGYKFNQYLGMESQYTGIGKVTDNVSGSAKGDALSLTAIVFLPTSDMFNLYGKLGVAAAKTTVSSSLSPMNDANRTSVTYGLGGEYNFNKNIGMRLGWDHYNAAVGMSGGNKHDVGANVVSMGVVYNF